ncbi:MAG: hypothetical protein H8D56_12425 [Planctomycetes bacterium]|nr:hypothetical protein [Planctomycetota bacterium]MBL7143649.1 hypothetical protein [Phycisphaerae bacterium]
MDKKEELLNAIFKVINKVQASEDKKRLTCSEAFELANKYDVEIIEIGRMCNQHNIKISKCQFGCF